jgi:uncharacterized repeat protein (TIGR04042 family)
MIFSLRWPDATETRNYSPSSIIAEYFRAGETIALPQFLRRARVAMRAASDRVVQTYGYPCARAAATLAAIEQTAAKFLTDPDAAVTILEIRP